MRKLILISLLFFVGCSSTEVEYDLTPVFVPVICEDPIALDPIKTEPVVYVKAIDEQGEVVAGLNAVSISNVIINRADTLRYVKGQSGVIDYYKNCIEIHNSNQNEEGEPD